MMEGTETCSGVQSIAPETTAARGSPMMGLKRDTPTEEMPVEAAARGSPMMEVLDGYVQRCIGAAKLRSAMEVALSRTRVGAAL